MTSPVRDTVQILYRGRKVIAEVYLDPSDLSVQCEALYGPEGGLCVEDVANLEQPGSDLNAAITLAFWKKREA